MLVELWECVSTCVSSQNQEKALRSLPRILFSTMPYIEYDLNLAILYEYLI